MSFCLQVKRHFRPELLNRLDEIVIFDPLSQDQLRKVARLQMRDVASRLAERGIALAVSDAALDIVLSESYDPVCDIFESSSFCFFYSQCTYFFSFSFVDASLVQLNIKLYT